MNNIISLDKTIALMENFLYQIIDFIPTLILALIALIVGYFIAISIKKIIIITLEKIKFNQIFQKTVGEDVIKKAEWKVDPSEFVGLIIKWIILIIVLSIVAEILGIVQFVNFLQGVLVFLGQIVLALLIFIVAIIFAEYLSKIVRIWAEGMKIGYSEILALIVKALIWKFAIFAILIELGIAEELVLVLFQGMVIFLVLAAGIAFGLGGKEVATEILRNIQKKIKK